MQTNTPTQQEIYAAALQVFNHTTEENIAYIAQLLREAGESDFADKFEFGITDVDDDFDGQTINSFAAKRAANAVMAKFAPTPSSMPEKRQRNIDLSFTRTTEFAVITVGFGLMTLIFAVMYANTMLFGVVLDQGVTTLELIFVFVAGGVTAITGYDIFWGAIMSDEKATKHFGKMSTRRSIYWVVALSINIIWMVYAVIYLVS